MKNKRCFNFLCDMYLLKFVQLLGCISCRCAFIVWRSRRDYLFARTLSAVKKERFAPSFLAFPAGVLTSTNLTRREKRTVCTVLFGAWSAVLISTRLARRSQRFRRVCSHSRALKSAPRRCAFIVWRSRREYSLARTLPAVKKRTANTVLFGVPGGSRTHGLSLRRRTLYPTELRKHAFCKSIIYYADMKIKQIYRVEAIRLH